MPVALIVLHAVRKRGAGLRLTWWLMHAAVLLLPVLIYMPLRYVVLGYRLARANHYIIMNPLLEAGPSERIIGAFTILGHYTRLFFFPARLSADYGMAVIDPAAGATAMTWLGVLAAAGLLVGLAGYLRRGTTWRNIAIATAIWLASYVLISNTVMLYGATLAERLMYWPSVPVVILVAVAGTALWRKVAEHQQTGRAAWQTVGAAVVIVVVLALGTRSAVRNHDWRTAIALFTKDAATYTQSVQLNGNAAFAYHSKARETEDEQLRRQYLERAVKYYERDAAIHADNWGTASHWADALARLGDLDGAIVQARRALELAPRDANLQAALGQYLLANGQPAEALPYVEQAARSDPANRNYMTLLMQAAHAAQQVDRAIQVLEAIATSDGKNWYVRQMLSVVCRQADPAKGLRYAQEACQTAPGRRRQPPAAGRGARGGGTGAGRPCHVPSRVRPTAVESPAAAAHRAANPHARRATDDAGNAVAGGD